MKKKAMIAWVVFVICVISTVALRYLADRQLVEYDEVTARVVSAETKTLRNRKYGTTYKSYQITVEYEGKNYKLKNAHSTYEYPEGKNVTVYLSSGKLYADVAGIRSSTTLFYSYLIFLLGSVVMLGVAISYTARGRQE